jgi:hypothetical protein
MAAAAHGGGVAGVVLLTPAFFAQFPGVRFLFAGPGRPLKTNPVIYKYGDGELEEEVSPSGHEARCQATACPHATPAAQLLKNACSRRDTAPPGAVSSHARAAVRESLLLRRGAAPAPGSLAWRFVAAVLQLDGHWLARCTVLFVTPQEFWDISVVDAFVSTLFPGFGAPPAPPVRGWRCWCGETQEWSGSFTVQDVW